MQIFARCHPDCIEEAFARNPVCVGTSQKEMERRDPAEAVTTLIEGHCSATKEGVAQGSVLSPLLANVYLHYVLDEWFEQEVKPRLSGESYLIRYADDFICAFEHASDAQRFQVVLRKRLARYSLELVEDKTKLLRFGRYAASSN